MEDCTGNKECTNEEESCIREIKKDSFLPCILFDEDKECYCLDFKIFNGSTDEIVEDCSNNVACSNEIEVEVVFDDEEGFIEFDLLEEGTPQTCVTGFRKVESDEYYEYIGKEEYEGEEEYEEEDIGDREFSIPILCSDTNGSNCFCVTAEQKQAAITGNSGFRASGAKPLKYKTSTVSTYLFYYLSQL